MRWWNLTAAMLVALVAACGGGETAGTEPDGRTDQSVPDLSATDTRDAALGPEADGAESTRPDVPEVAGDLADTEATADHEAEPATDTTTDAPPDTPESDLTADLTVDAPGPDLDASGPCPGEMAWVAETFCIDRWEAALEEQAIDGTWAPSAPYLTVAGRTVRAVAVEGRVPQGYISGVEAEAACAGSGKRLCTSDEWLAACRGPLETTWPYGDVHVEHACNDDYPGHPVVDYFGTSEGVWDDAHMNDPGIDQLPGTVAPAGAHPLCVSAWGVADLHGNLHEWVDDADGTFRGGFFADGAINGEGCLYVTTAHAVAYHDYSTGFRCCRTP